MKKVFFNLKREHLGITFKSIDGKIKRIKELLYSRTHSKIIIFITIIVFLNLSGIV